MARSIFGLVILFLLATPAHSQGITAGDPGCAIDCLTGFSECLGASGCQIVDAARCANGEPCNGGFCGSSTQRCPRLRQPPGCGTACDLQRADCVQTCGPRFSIQQVAEIIEGQFDPEIAQQLLEPVVAAMEAARNAVGDARPQVIEQMDSYRARVRALAGSLIDEATADTLEDLAFDVEMSLSEQAFERCFLSPLEAGALGLQSKAIAPSP